MTELPYIIRLAITAVFFFGLGAIAYYLRSLAKATWVNNQALKNLHDQGQADHAAREQVLVDLRATAETLAIRTQQALDDREVVSGTRHDAVMGQIAENTRLTTAAADASANAAEVANAVNEKIQKTNDRLEEQGKENARLHADARHAEEENAAIHAHIAQVADVSAATLEKTTVVDGKIDGITSVIKDH